MKIQCFQCLKKNNLDENTLVIFTSDNGGLTQRNGKHDDFTENIPLRRGKGSAFEGGVRVPGIVYWPNKTPVGKVCSEPITSVDYYPTILSASGVLGDAEHNKNIDGIDLTGIFKNPSKKLDRDIFWHYPHYHAGGDWPYSSIRSGDYRLIESLEDGHVELYHLGKDLGEMQDLSSQFPEKALVLKASLKKWRASVSAQLPTLNSNYDPKRASETAKNKKKKSSNKNK